MNLPRVAILLLRGLEGCGVSNYSRHFKAYYDSQNAKCDIYALQTRIGRSDTSSDMDVKFFKYSDRADIVSALNRDYDVILIFSVPDVKEDEQITSTYVSEILDKLNPTKVMYQHDHHKNTMKRNAGFQEAIESCNKVFSHSLNNTSSGFIDWMNTRGITVKREKIDIFFHVPFISHLINYERDTRKKRVVHASRAVAWKRGTLILNLQPYLRDRGFITEMIGFERSIAGFTQINAYKDLLNWYTTEEFSRPVKAPSPFSNSKINTEYMDWLDEVGQDPQYMYVIGSYEYHRGLKRVAESAFASQPRTFEHNKLCYGNAFIEYQGIEAALLSVPFYHRHFLDTVTFPGTDTPLSKYDIFLSIDDDARAIAKGGPQVLNPDAFADKLEEVWSDPKLYTKYRKNSTEFMLEYYSSDKIVPKMMEKVMA